MKSRKFTCRCCGSNKFVAHTSKYTGVSLHKPSNKYRTRISIDGKTISLGYFKDEVNAAVAYDEYVLANGLINKQLNFPHERLR